MAFTDETFRLSVTGAFTGTGSSDLTFTYSADFFIAGTFVGTVVVEAQDLDGDWHGVCEFTAPAAQTLRFARARPIRITCSAFTSGTINYNLEAIDAYERQR